MDLIQNNFGANNFFDIKYINKKIDIIFQVSLLNK